MAITILCPNLLCKQALQVLDDERGQRVRCPHCQQVLLVPVRQSPRAAPESPADQTVADK